MLFRSPKYTANNTFVGWKVDGTLIDEKNLNADGSYTFTMTSKELTVEAVIEEGNQTSSSVIVQNKNENQTLENIKIAVLISSVLIVSLATGFIIFNKKRKGK